MSITEKMKAAFKAKPMPNPADLEARIAGQQALVADIEQRHALASLDWAAGVRNAGERMQALYAELTAAKGELAGLEAAYKLALREKERTDAINRAALHATQINAIVQHLAARDKAAAELASLLEQVAAAYKTLVHRSDKAMAANPLGGQWPGGSMCELGAIKELIECELYRLAGDPSIGGKLTFPGARCGDLRFLSNPDAIRPMVEAITEASKHVLNVLKGRKDPPAAPAPAVEQAPTAPPPPPAAAAASEEEPIGPKVDARAYVPPKRRLV
jgi:hypothetical protein